MRNAVKSDEILEKNEKFFFQFYQCVNFFKVKKSYIDENKFNSKINNLKKKNILNTKIS